MSQEIEVYAIGWRENQMCNGHFEFNRPLNLDDENEIKAFARAAFDGLGAHRIAIKTAHPDWDNVDDQGVIRRFNKRPR